jgi:hypothetical protein
MVNDNIIELADNNITTDTVDIGWYSPAGNTSKIWYSGLVRQAAKSSNSNPYFWLFVSNTNPNTATTVDTSANSGTGTLQAYLVPYGTGGAFVANSTVVNITANSTVSSTITANSLYGTVLTATQGTINHDSLANFVGNEHIDHTTVTLTAGNGLTGGGTIAASRTFDIGQGNGISVSADAIAAAAANGISVTSSGINVLAGNNQLISNTTGLWIDQTKIDHNSLSNYAVNRHIDHTAVSITAGNGLSGGGDISSTRSLAVLANTGIISNSSGVFANSTYIQSLVNVSNGSVTTSGTTAQNIDSFLIGSYLGSEYLISVSDNVANNKYVSKVLVMHDGSASQITEYASITSNSNVGVFSATQNSTHIILQFTPALSATTVKYTRTVV